MAETFTDASNTKYNVCADVIFSLFESCEVNCGTQICDTAFLICSNFEHKILHCQNHFVIC